jgi:hypothetical protein
VFLEQDIYVIKIESFQVTFLHIFDKYILPNVNTEATIDVRRSNQMQFWQNHLNFAVWCATTGCGVGIFPHLMGAYNKSPEAKFLRKAIYNFHVYFRIRRVLKDMGCPLPNSKEWNPLNNPINMAQCERVCNEFGISKNTF